MLIDATSTLNQDDVALLRTLYEAGIPAMVLLSKADLLSTSDRAKMATYIEEQLQQELGLSLPVHPVSAVGADESLLLRWYDSEVSPLLERHQSLAEASLRRKIASLSESVATSLESLRLRGGASENSQVEGLAEARRLFDEADEAIRRARQQLLDWSMLRERVLELILQLAAQSAGAEEQSSSAGMTGCFTSPGRSWPSVPGWPTILSPVSSSRCAAHWMDCAALSPWQMTSSPPARTGSPLVCRFPT